MMYFACFCVFFANMQEQIRKKHSVMYGFFVFFVFLLKLQIRHVQLPMCFMCFCVFFYKKKLMTACILCVFVFCLLQSRPGKTIHVFCVFCVFFFLEKNEMGMCFMCFLCFFFYKKQTDEGMYFVCFCILFIVVKTR